MFKNNKAFSGFSVNDMYQARDFYSKVLGMEVTTGEMGTLNLKIANGSNVLIY
jgi:catechol-2,3-dioxygenase